MERLFTTGVKRDVAFAPRSIHITFFTADNLLPSNSRLT